jgi:CubicO group peptidase (beta-lactamase class C family)
MRAPTIPEGLFRLRRSLLRRWREATAFGAAVLLACASSSDDAIDPTRLAAFVDSLIPAEMAGERIPGAAFVFVQDGRVVLMRGYGLADVEHRRSADPRSTIWRVGSISKVFTATAVMQLVERGLVDLDQPVDRYLRRVTIPATYPDPVTVRQLLTHTAGFDEIRPGTQAATADSVLPLDVFLRDRLVRVRPPGRTIAYSTYGVTLAGEMVEEVSGVPFESYLKRNIWDPLGMEHSCITVPVQWRNDIARGYEIVGDSAVAQVWEWYHTTPASSINATAADMARFLLAHLGGGAMGRARILSKEAEKEMQRRQVTMDPALPGYAIGFSEDFVGGVRVVEHGGNMAGFSSLMVLIPEENAGFFVVNHLEGSRLRDNLKWALLERFFARARERKPVPPLPPATSVRAERFAGRYAPLTSCWSCNPVRVSSLMTVTANPDGTLEFAGGRWIAVDSLRFVHDNGSGYIAFDTDSTGAIEHVFAGAFWGWQKIPDE